MSYSSILSTSQRQESPGGIAFGGAESGTGVVATKVRLGINPLLANTDIDCANFALEFINRLGNNLLTFQKAGSPNNWIYVGQDTEPGSFYFPSNSSAGGTEGSMWGIATGSGVFQQIDPLLFMAWNYKGTGAAIDQTKFATGIGMEALYEPIDPASRRSEHYSFFQNDNGADYRRGWMLEYFHSSLRTDLLHVVSNVQYFNALTNVVDSNHISLQFDFGGGEVVFGSVVAPQLLIKQRSFDGARKVNLVNMDAVTLGGMQLSFAGGAPFAVNDSMTTGTVLRIAFPLLTTNFWGVNNVIPNFTNQVGGQVYAYGGGGITDPSGFQRIQAGYRAAASAIDLSGASDVPDSDRAIIFYTSATERLRLQGGTAKFSGTIATGANVQWDFGAYTAAVSVPTGYLTVQVGGATYRMQAELV